MKLGIDPGKFRTKAVTMIKGEWIKFDVRSKIMVNPISIMAGDNYLIGYEGQKFLIGEGANDYSLDTDKQSLQHKLCTYLAINKLAQETPVELVVGCPFSLFKKADKREAYWDYIRGNEIIKLDINDEESVVNIIDGTAFAECGGIAYAEPEEEFEDNIRGVVDIGGLNVNGCIFENLSPVLGTDFTENLGSIIFQNNLKQELNKEYPEINLQDYDMKNIIRRGLIIDGKKEQRANKIIDESLGNHFDSIIKVLKKKNWSVKTLDITVSGGGSLDIGIDIIQHYIPQAKLSSDPVWDNAKGFYYVAEMLFKG